MHAVTHEIASTYCKATNAEIEQPKGLREDAPMEGWFWTQVRGALHDTWPDCKDATCEIGPPQPNPAGCTRGEPCGE